MVLPIHRSADGSETLAIGGQTFPVAQNPRQVTIPLRLLEGLRLSDLPDELAAVPLGFTLPEVSSRQPMCQIYAFRDDMAWIRVGIAASSDAEGLLALDCLSIAVRERQEGVGDIEQDDVQDCETQQGLFYGVAFSNDITVGEALARVATIAGEIAERSRELMRAAADAIKRRQSLAG